MVVHAAALLPIAPLILLPFILIFFVVVFPFWLVALLLVGAVRGVALLIDRKKAGKATQAIDRAFRWVVTFGGFTETLKGKNEPPPAG